MNGYVTLFLLFLVLIGLVFAGFKILAGNAVLRGNSSIAELDFATFKESVELNYLYLFLVLIIIFVLLCVMCYVLFTFYSSTMIIRENTPDRPMGLNHPTFKPLTQNSVPTEINSINYANNVNQHSAPAEVKNENRLEIKPHVVPTLSKNQNAQGLTQPAKIFKSREQEPPRFNNANHTNLLLPNHNTEFTTSNIQANNSKTPNNPLHVKGMGSGLINMRSRRRNINNIL